MPGVRVKSSQEVVRRPLSPVSECRLRKVSDGSGTIDRNKKALRLSLIPRRSLGTLSNSRMELGCRLFFKHHLHPPKNPQHRRRVVATRSKHIDVRQTVNWADDVGAKP
jgi:hypothetical protein